MEEFSPQKTKEMRGKLCNRYMELMRRLGASTTASVLVKCWDEVERRYEEAHRHYHGVGHIVHLLLCFELMRKYAKDPDIIEAAIFYHDVVYEPGSPENEEQSALLWERHAYLLCLPYDRTARVAEYVRASKRHRGDPEANPDLCLFLDLDLVSLAAEPAVFDRHSREIREEFSHFADEEFYSGRMEWIDSMLDKKRRPNIFLTKLFRQKYEARARANLTEEYVRIERDS